MKENPYPIAPEGLPFIAATGFFTLGMLYFFPWPWAVVPALATFFCVWFFRDPTRKPPQASQDGTETVTSPADGTIVGIAEVEESRFLHTKMQRVCIFMSPLNVHVNRAPVSGKVLKTHYNPGKFMNAAADKASLDNEQNAIFMKTKKGFEIIFVQIAGFIARRIVCYAKEGDDLSLGQRFGLIRFGSRVDVYLPVDAQINVAMNQRVQAGETILASLRK